MGRKNRRRTRPQARRREDGISVGRSPRVSTPVERLVIPQGRCYRNSRKGKLKFAVQDAPAALRQAKARRKKSGSRYVETRWYECEVCGFAHLTSAEEYEERGGNHG